jgi:hypothetical protein
MLLFHRIITRNAVDALIFVFLSQLLATPTGIRTKKKQLSAMKVQVFHVAFSALPASSSFFRKLLSIIS